MMLARDLRWSAAAASNKERVSGRSLIKKGVVLVVMFVLLVDTAGKCTGNPAKHKQQANTRLNRRV
jgi:hypothetical protein